LFRKTVSARAIASATMLALLLVSMFSFVRIARTASSVVVTSNPDWTDTGLSTAIGETIEINASGSWTVNINGGIRTGPDGNTAVYGYWDDFLYEAYQGELIAFIGADPYQGQWGNGSFFPQHTGYWAIGSSCQFTSNETGELWLGINDDAVSKTNGDNSGTMTASITTTQTCAVGFVESGLPQGVGWSVTFSGQTQISTSNSTTFLAATGGVYPFSVGPPVGYDASPSNGSITVNGSTVWQTISFVQAQDVVISSNMTLTSDLWCFSLAIKPGITLTTSGFSIICSGTVTVDGTIETGFPRNDGLAGGGNGGSFFNAYGGSGGGGGFNNGGGGTGGSTIAAGGAGGTSGYGNGTGKSGSTPVAPALSNSTIQSMFANGFVNYLSGAGGGAGQVGSGQFPNGNGGSGAYGVYIQANQIVNNGIIIGSGQNGNDAPSGPNNAGGGGGGGGLILLAYGIGGLIEGTCTTAGGSGGLGAGSPGGNGGNGQVLTYNYGNEPPTSFQSWTSVSCSPNPALVGLRVTCIATLSGSNPTGTITWSTNSSTGSFSSPNPSTLSSGSCSINYTDTSAGSANITASYSGDSNNGPSSGSSTLVLSGINLVPLQQTLLSQPETGNSWSYLNPNIGLAAGETALTNLEIDAESNLGTTFNGIVNSFAYQTDSIKKVFDVSSSQKLLAAFDAQIENLGSSTGSVDITAAFSIDAIPISWDSMLCKPGGIVVEAMQWVSGFLTFPFKVLHVPVATPTITGDKCQIIIKGLDIASELAGTPIALLINASAITFDQLGVGSDFNGTSLVVDGTSYNVGVLPVTFIWSTGSIHTFAFQSPLVVEANAEQYVWTGTTGLSSMQGGSINATTDGSIIGNYVIPVHDVAVTNVTFCKRIIGQGYSGNITAATENLGGYTETFNLTAYANATSIGSENVTLTAGNSTTVQFTWNTTGFAFGNYTLNANVQPANNNLTGGTVEVTIPGDVNGDGTVNILDAIVLGNAFLATPGSSNWNPNADINGDNVVNILDAIILSNNFLQHYP
jgi:hypothetical protein